VQATVPISQEGSRVLIYKIKKYINEAHIFENVDIRHGWRIKKVVKIGLQGIDVDEEYLEGLFLRLNDQIGRMVKKDCYTIQEAYILIHSWYEVLAEVFGKLTDKYSGQEIISLPYSDREELGKLGRQAIFQPQFQEISYALDQIIDSHSQKASMWCYGHPIDKL
jgi:hypothetical protein